MSKVKILGQEYDSWEAPGCYAIGLLLILVGGFLVYTCPAPTSGILVTGTQPWQSEAWLNQSQSGLIMPTDIVTPTTEPTLTPSIKPTMMPTDKPVIIVTPGNNTGFNANVQSGVNVNMFTGVALGLFGICSILIGEIAAGRETTRRLKKQIKELTATTTSTPAPEASAPVVEGKQDAEK